MNRINNKRKAKSISTYDFSTLYTTLPHDKLIPRLSKVIDFVFKGGDESFLQIFDKKVLWGKKKKGLFSDSVNLP